MSNSVFYLSIAIGVALGAWGAYLAEKKNRSRQLGFLLGFFFWNYWDFNFNIND